MYNGGNPYRCWTITSLALGFAAIAVCSASSSTQPSSAPAVDLMLEPIGYPAGVADESQYAEFLVHRLKQMHAEIGGLGDPDAKAEAYLQLAAFALTKGVEPSLSRLWLARAETRDIRTARRFIDAARSAIDVADQVRLGEQEAEQDVTQLASRISRLSTLADLIAALVDTADKSAALRAAQSADAVLEDLPESAQPAWNLLIAACLQRAGKNQAALLRLHSLLRRQKRPRTALAAAILQCQVLRQAGNYAAAVALVAEYAQKMVFGVSDLPQTEPDRRTTTTRAKTPDQANELGRALVPSLPVRTARCTLTFFEARLLREWAAKLAKSTNADDRQTALTIQSTAAKLRRQAESLGPNLMRLSPVLETLSDITAPRR